MDEKREIKDSGSTREFGTGAHRDNAEGKGRFDLLPARELIIAYNTGLLQIFGEKTDRIIDVRTPESLRELLRKAMELALTTQKMMKKNEIITAMGNVAAYTILASGAEEDEETGDIKDGVFHDSEAYFWYGAIQVSKHYEEGANKYGANNWQNGMPANVYMDSCMRHIAKAIAGMKDEYHIRAAAWNALCFMWTVRNKPELDNYCPDEDKV